MQDSSIKLDFNDLLFVTGDASIPASFAALRHKVPMIQKYAALAGMEPDSNLRIKVPTGIDCDSVTLFLELLQAHSSVNTSEFV